MNGLFECIEHGLQIGVRSQFVERCAWRGWLQDPHAYKDDIRSRADMLYQKVIGLSGRDRLKASGTFFAASSEFFFCRALETRIVGESPYAFLRTAASHIVAMLCRCMADPEVREDARKQIASTVEILGTSF